MNVRGGTTQDGSARFPGASGTVGVSVRESDSTVVRGNLISGFRKVGTNHHSGEVFARIQAQRGTDAPRSV